MIYLRMSKKNYNAGVNYSIMLMNWVRSCIIAGLGCGVMNITSSSHKLQKNNDRTNERTNEQTTLTQQQ